MDRVMAWKFGFRLHSDRTDEKLITRVFCQPLQQKDSKEVTIYPE
jgi:hypothetical protein